MSFSSLPTEMKSLVIQSAVDQHAANRPMPSYLSHDQFAAQLRGYGRSLASLSLVDTKFQRLVRPVLEAAKEAYKPYRRADLRAKYSYYADPGQGRRLGAVSSCLYDAVLSGCTLSGAHSSQPAFNENVERETRELLELMPLSVHWDKGSFEGRTRVSVFAAACYNPQVPEHILHSLLEKNADAHCQIEVKGISTPLIEDLRLHFAGTERLTMIERIFQDFA
jgi:hypothetical protein